MQKSGYFIGDGCVVRLSRGGYQEVRSKGILTLINSTKKKKNSKIQEKIQEKIQRYSIKLKDIQEKIQINFIKIC